MDCLFDWDSFSFVYRGFPTLFFRLLRLLNSFFFVLGRDSSALYCYSGCTSTFPNDPPVFSFLRTFIRGWFPYVLCVHSDFPYYCPHPPAPNMATLENDHNPKRRCTCPPNVDTEENCVVTERLSTRPSFVGMWTNLHSSDPSLQMCMFNLRITCAAAHRNRRRIARL